MVKYGGIVSVPVVSTAVSSTSTGAVSTVSVVSSTSTGAVSTVSVVSSTSIGVVSTVSVVSSTISVVSSTSTGAVSAVVSKSSKIVAVSSTSTGVVSTVSVVSNMVEIASGGLCIIPASCKTLSTNSGSRPASIKALLVNSISSDLVNPEFTAVVFIFDTICPTSLLGKAPVVVNVVPVTLIGSAMPVVTGVVGTSS